MIREQWEGKRGPKRRLSLAEIIMLNILRFYRRIHDLKTFHRLVRNAYRDYFPGLPNYENFLKTTNRSLPAIAVFMKHLLFLAHMGGRGKVEGKYFIDSTAPNVCEDPSISTHRVTTGYASRGKSGRGWFFGSTPQGSGSIGLYFVMQAHPPCTALYAVSVRRFGTLPSASFRFHLTLTQSPVLTGPLGNGTGWIWILPWEPGALAPKRP